MSSARRSRPSRAGSGSRSPTSIACCQGKERASRGWIAMWSARLAPGFGPALRLAASQAATAGGGRPTGLVLFGAGLCVYHVDRAILRWLRCDRSAVLGLAWTALLAPRDRRRVRAAIRALQLGAWPAGRLHWMRADGTCVATEVRVVGCRVGGLACWAARLTRMADDGRRRRSAGARRQPGGAARAPRTVLSGAGAARDDPRGPRARLRAPDPGPRAPAPGVRPCAA